MALFEMTAGALIAITLVSVILGVRRRKRTYTDPAIASAETGTPTRSRWLSAVVSGIAAGVVAAGAIWFTFPQKYIATSWIKIDPTTPAVAFKNVASDQDSSSFQTTQGVLLKSRFVLMSALRPTKISQLSIVREQDDPIDWLQKELTVDFQLSNEIMRLQIQGYKPQELSDLLASIVNSYMEEVVMGDKKARNERLDALRAQGVVFEERLRTKRRTLKELSDRVGASSANRFQSALLEDHEKELIQLQRELRDMRLETINENNNNIKASGTTPGGREMQVQSTAKVKALRERIAMFEEKQKILETDTQRLRSEVCALQPDSASLETAEDEIEAVGSTARKLREMIIQMEIEQSAPPRVTVWDRADVQLATTTPQLTLLASGGGFAAMLLVSVLVGLWGPGPAGRKQPPLEMQHG